MDARKDAVDSKISLQPVKVFYANRSVPGQYGFPLHGFTVVSAPIPSIPTPDNWLKETKGTPDAEKKRKARAVQTAEIRQTQTLDGRSVRVFNFGPSFLSYKPVVITSKIVKQVEDSNKFDAEFKKTIKRFENKIFISEFHALRSIICDVKKFSEMHPVFPKDEKQFTQDDIALRDEIDRINFLARSPKQNPYKEYKTLCEQLVSFSELNVDRGPMVPYFENAGHTPNDIQATKDHKSNLEQQPFIHPVSIYEVFSLQMAAQYYREEQLIVQSKLADSKELQEQLSAKSRSEVLKAQLVYFDYVPLTEKAANCNKSTATFLEAALHHSLRFSLKYLKTEKTDTADKADPANIKSATAFSFASSQRMLLWGSDLYNHLAHQVKKLLVTSETISDEKEEYDLISLAVDKVATTPQYLVNHKYDILEAIKLLETEKQILALEQIGKPETPLGKIFATRITGNLRDPDQSRGALLEAAKRLKVLQDDFEKIKADSCSL